MPPAGAGQIVAPHTWLSLHTGEPVESSFLLEEGRRSIRMEPGMLSLIPSGSVHQTRTPPTAKIQLIAASPHEALLKAIEGELGQNTRSLRLMRGFQDELLKQLLVTLCAEISSAAPLGNLYVETLARNITVQLLCRYSDKPFQPRDYRGGLSPTNLRIVLEYMDARNYRDIELAELARLTGFSVYHFAKAFRRCTGCPPYTYVLQQRIKLAQRLLVNPKLPMQKVAEASGFTSASHFGAVYRRLTGHTPGAYRLHQCSAKVKTTTANGE